MAKQGYILTLFDSNIINFWEKLHDDIYESGKVSYIGSQVEVCPQSGRDHWQAFVWFSKANKQRGTWFKKYAAGIHFEAVTALKAQAINYGTKEESRKPNCEPKRSGIPPQADGCEWEQLQKAVEEKDKSMVPFKMLVRYNIERRWEELGKFYETDHRSDLPAYLPNPWGKILISRQAKKKRHFWIFSRLPNFGKTYYFAKPLVKDYKAVIQTGNFDYWNVEKVHQCVILDEYNTAKLKWDTLNAMCDGTYLYRRMYLKSLCMDDPLIIVLSNSSISDLYPNTNVFLYARFNEIELM